MALQLTCPSCTSGFALTEDARYAKVFCPKCGTSLTIGSDGVAHRNELPVPSLTHPARAGFWKKRAVIFTAIAIFTAGGITGVMVARAFATDPPVDDRHSDTANTQSNQAQSVAIHQNEQAAPATNSREQTVATIPGPTNSTLWEYKVLAIQPLQIPPTGGSYSFQKLADVYSNVFSKTAVDGWEFDRTMYFPDQGLQGNYAVFKHLKRAQQ